ncbi:MAG: hypothetical protein ACM3KM_04525 [Acidobacteriaceae bacterium]
MDNQKHLEEIAEKYRELAKTDPSIDVATLMSKLLESPSNLVSDKERKWAYAVSLFFPPFGLLFALRFYMGDKDDGKKTALVCVGFTVLALIIVWLTMRTFMSSVGTNLDQLQQIKPQDYQDLYQ